MSTELKVVMFTDEVESTPRTRERTPAEIRRVARDQDDLAAEAVRQCSGTILKGTGDGHFVQFRSCSDAVRCGFILQQRVKARNEAQDNDLLKFDLHVGIDCGELVILEDGDLRGNAANLAARVCSECPPGEVYLTEKVKDELHPREAEVQEVGRFELKGIDEKVTIYRLLEWLGPIETAANPFIWRRGVTRAEDFFDRDNDLRRLRDFVTGRQNCQIVGPRRIGKTSLLLAVGRSAVEWDEAAIVAHLDLQDPRCFTLSGFLAHVGRQFEWATVPTRLSGCAESVGAMISEGKHPVLCLDEFEELRARPREFTRDFFLTLRSCGGQGMSIVTASRKALSDLTEPGDPTSPFYNIFDLMPLGPLADADAEDFVTLHRPGVAPFTPDEKEAVLEFARGHPLALQVACYHALEAKRAGETTTRAMADAAADMRASVCAGW